MSEVESRWDLCLEDLHWCDDLPTGGLNDSKLDRIREDELFGAYVATVDAQWETDPGMEWEPTPPTDNEIDDLALWATDNVADGSLRGRMISYSASKRDRGQKRGGG